MMTRLLTAALILAASGAFALGRRPPAEAKQPPKEKTAPMSSLEWTGQYGGPGEPGFEVVSNSAGWTALWRKFGKDAPELDLEKNVAVAVFVGEKPTGGFTVEFLEPQTQSGVFLVRAVVKTPTGFTTQAFSQPWKIRSFPRPEGRVVVEVRPE